MSDAELERIFVRMAEKAFAKAQVPTQRAMRVHPFKHPYRKIKRVLKTHCLKGHARTPDNVGMNHQCLECRRIRNKANRAAYAKMKGNGRSHPGAV